MDIHVMDLFCALLLFEITSLSLISVSIYRAVYAKYYDFDMYLNPGDSPVRCIPFYAAN